MSLGLEEQALVAREVAALRQRGWPAGRALKLAAGGLPPGCERDAIASLAADLEGGRPPSPAKEPFLALLARGDAAGAAALLEEVRALELEREARRDWGRTVVLPGLMLCVGLAAIGLFGHLTRMSSTHLLGNESTLPGPTLLALDVQRVMTYLAPVLIVTIVLGMLLAPRRWAPGVRALKRAAALRRYAAAIEAGSSEAAALGLIDPKATTLLGAEALGFERYERALGLCMQAEGPVEVARAIASEVETSAQRSMTRLRLIGPGLGIAIVAGTLVLVILNLFALYLPIFSIAGSIH